MRIALLAVLASVSLTTGAQTGKNARHATAAEQTPAPSVEVRIDAAARRQVMEGFGATTASLTYNNGRVDNVPPALRSRALRAVYGEVKLTTGNVLLGLFEPQNDNDDPDRIDWSRFEVDGVRVISEKLVAPAAALGADGLFPSANIDHRYRAWMSELRRTNYLRYLDECAEFVLAAVIQWREITGSEPRYYALFNEPLTGNNELRGGSLHEVIDLVKHVGARLRKEGFKRVKFVVPNEETIAANYRVARALLSDPEARQYVGAIGYHPYPYGSAYVDVGRILAASGAGKPDPAAVAERQRLSELAAQYDVAVWMSEVSHANADPRSMDHLRGRAIHIHDELKYANASAFFGMHAMWDSRSHAEHFAGRGDPGFFSEADTIVLIENELDRVTITGMGYAIGHYARWMSPGAVRLDAASDDPLVLATAFYDSAKRAAAVVLINNATSTRMVHVDLNGLNFAEALRGEQSFGNVRWQPIAAIKPAAAGRFSVTLPPRSVTSLGAGIAGGDPTGGPAR